MLLSLLLGIWIGGTAIMWVVATANFRTVDRVLERPTAEAQPALSSVPPAIRRPLLRHLASELNRLFFSLWGAAQLALGTAVLVLLWRRPARDPGSMYLAVALVLLVLVLTAGITPAITRLGRAVDFLPRDPPPSQMRVFWPLHAAYSVLDLLKMVLLVLLARRLR